MAHSEEVRKYYDKNTDLFLRYGKDEKTQNIHAALWEDGNSSLKEAMHFANELIFQEIIKMDHSPLHIVDLGCGVGSSLFYLAQKLPKNTHLSGISISGEQIKIAKNNTPENLSDQLSFFQGDFLNTASYIQHADVGYAIEAFTHCESAISFFQEAGKIIPSKGLLIIIDDVLTENYQSLLTTSNTNLLNTYKDFWLLASLHSIEKLSEISATAGFHLTHQKDLTPLLKIRRPRDRFITFLLFFFSKLADYSYYWKSLKGGDAKQQCYQKGLTAYKLLVFEKE